MEKERSTAVELVGLLIILSSLYKIMVVLDFSIFKLLFQPLSEKIIIAHYSISLIISMLLLISGFGVLFHKNIFRKIILVIASYTFLFYLAEGPFFYFKNFYKLAEQAAIEIAAKIPNFPTSIYSSILWVIAVLFWVIDFAFAVWLVYFFTRHRVKEQFK